MAGLAHHPLRSCIALAYCAPLCVADGAAKAKLNIIRAVLAADETPRSRRSLAREARKVPVDRNAWDARRNGFQNPGISGGSHWGREPGVVPPKVCPRGAGRQGKTSERGGEQAHRSRQRPGIQRAFFYVLRIPRITFFTDIVVIVSRGDLSRAREGDSEGGGDI